MSGLMEILPGLVIAAMFATVVVVGFVLSRRRGTRGRSGVGGASTSGGTAWMFGGGDSGAGGDSSGHSCGGGSCSGGGCGGGGGGSG